MLKSLSTAFVAVALSAAALPAAADGPTNKDLAKAAMAAIFDTHDAAAVTKLFREDYIQHNPVVPTGRAPLVGFLPALDQSGIEVTRHRYIEDGDLVAVHSHATNAQIFGADELVVFDIFRMQDGKVAEHWDLYVPVAAPNPSGRTQIDGAVTISDLDKTDENKALVRAFVEQVLKGGDVAAMPQFIGDPYLQHNAQVGDGLEAVTAFFAGLAEQGVRFSYDTIHMVIGEGNFVLVVSEGTINDAPTAFYDLWRVADGKLVEHWDIVRAIPDAFAHDNGMF